MVRKQLLGVIDFGGNAEILSPGASESVEDHDVSVNSQLERASQIVLQSDLHES